MDKTRHREEYLSDVRSKLLEHKWLESEKAGRDLGQEAVLSWIKRFAKIHRKEFVEKKLIRAESDLCCLKGDKNIPVSVIKLLDEIHDCVGSVKVNIELDDPGIKVEVKNVLITAS